MTKKHHFREGIRFFIGSHLDPEKDEELKETKAEMEGKVQKILVFLKEEDGSDGKEPMVDLVEDFLKQYQLLYARYDHLTGELRKKVHDKHDNDTSSSSSDSDSDDSPRKKGSKNGKLENVEIVESTAATEEKEALHLEYQGALNKSQEADMIIKGFTNEVGKLNEENSKLQDQNADLKLKLDKAGILEVELIHKLDEINREKDGLLLEKVAMENSILDGNSTIQELTTTVSLLKDEKEALHLELESLKTELPTLKEQLDSAEKEIDQLRQIQKATEEDNHSLSLKVSELSEEVGQAQQKIQHLVTESSKLEGILVEKEKELTTHKEMHEALINETSTRLRSMELEIDSLQSQRSEIEKQKEDELSALVKKLEDKEEDSSSQMEALTSKVNNMQLEIESLYDQKEKLEEQMEHQRIEMSALVKDSTLKIEQLTENFQNQLKTKDQKIDKLEDKVEDLWRDLEMKSDEINTLVEYFRTTEVKLRLANQKLRVTEQVLNEKEDDHGRKEEKLQQDQTSLIERITTLSGIIVTYKETQTKIKADVSDKVNDTLTQMDTFSMKFEEDYGHLESRIYEILNELKVALNWIKEAGQEKKLLMKEIDTLVQQLNDKRECEIVLKDKVAELEKSLQREEDEREHLTNTIHQLEEKIATQQKMMTEKDEKMGECERKMNEKDKGISELSEEKREVIRQLCIWIDYHHSRYDDLKEMISMNSRRRKAAT